MNNSLFIGFYAAIMYLYNTITHFKCTLNYLRYNSVPPNICKLIQTILYNTVLGLLLVTNNQLL